MMIRVMVAAFVILHFTTLISLNSAAPSIETCPPDQIAIDGLCVCNPESCTKPPCLTDLVEVVFNGSSNQFNSCCPIYSCEGCKNATKINGKCPCAPNAILNEKGQCECIDTERHLVKGECICNPMQCELPQICDKKSVLTIDDDGCCKKTRCVPCPDDSESSNIDSDTLDDHCVCLPCKTDCGPNQIVVIKKKGTSFPGSCCDLYECKPAIDSAVINNDKVCIVGDITYADGDEWWADDNKQECRCENRLALCKQREDNSPPSNCLVDGFSYNHNESWFSEDGCTKCTCVNSERKCISHYCDYKESQINMSTCDKDHRLYEHNETWFEEDECTKCLCLNGEIICDSKNCEPKELPILTNGGCRPLSNCNKQCTGGFKINKKGCEICKCNLPKIDQSILSKYNITMNDLIRILNEYSRNKTTSTTTTTVTPSSTTRSSTITTELFNWPSSSMPPSLVPPSVITLQNDGHQQFISSTETKITPTFPDNGKYLWMIFALIAALLIAFIATLICFCFYRNKQKHSLDITPSRGSYQYVSNSIIDNNNTIIEKSIIR